MTKTIDEKIDDLAISMAAGFEAIDKKIAALPDKDYVDKKNILSQDYIDKKISLLPDKSFLTDKLADLKGDLFVKLRREDAKVNFLIGLLRERSVLTESDVEHLRREFDIFPSMI